MRDRKNRGQQAVFPGQPIVFDVGPGGKIVSGRVVLSGTVTIAGGTQNGTLIDEGGPAGLIKRIKITATALAGSRYPSGDIVDCSPRALLNYAIMQHSGKKIVELLNGAGNAGTLNAGAAGSYLIYLSIPIFFSDCVQRTQNMTALNMDGVYSSVQVKVEFAKDLTGCFTGNDRTWSAGAGGLWCDWLDDRFDFQGDRVPVVQEDHTTLIPAANTRFVDPTLPKDGAFTQWLIMSELGAQHTLTDTILNKLDISAPNTLAFSEYANDIRQRMLDDEWIDPATTATGLHFVDFTDGSQEFNSILAPGLLAQFDVANPSGANLDSLHIYTRRLFPLPPAK